MAALQYADIFSNILRELYGQSQVSVDLYNSNSDIQIVNGKNLKIPKLSVSGYKDHSRGNLGFNAVHIQMNMKQKHWTTTETLSLL